MSETVNISRMAEIISEDIFSQFLWEKVGPTNINWSCLDAEHNKKTHPSDVVFTYDEAYSNKKTYINCDLKSYAKGTITPGTIKTAIESLAISLQCAHVSDEWHKLYVGNALTNFDIVGMLFVYNHDGLFDSDFDEMLTKASKEGIHIAKNQRIFVIGPQDIAYLTTVVNDIKISRYDLKSKTNTSHTLYFPDIITARLLRNEWGVAASLEMLSGPWQIVKYRIGEANDFGISFYYKRKGTSIEEFLYIIDYLFHYQLLQNAHEIQLKLPNAAPEANALFEQAIKEYGIRYNQSPEIQARLERIKYKNITNVVTQLYDIQIGMGYE